MAAIEPPAFRVPMPVRCSPPLICAALLALVLTSLVGCWPDYGPDYGLADPPDLSVRQSPNDTIRVGETVTFTAVFRDSLNPKWLYSWTLNLDGRPQVFGKERSIQWTPSMPGEYRSDVYVGEASATSSSTISFRTVVLP